VKIAYLTHDTPDVFYRVGQYLDFLHTNGIGTAILRTPRNPWKRLAMFASLPAFDAVVLQRKLFSGFWRLFLRRCARTLILDTDDAIMFSSREDRPFSRTRSQRYKAMVDLCDRVTVGNSYLKEETLKLCPDADVTVIPTVADTDRYPVRRHRKDERVVIGWIGSASTIKYLGIVKPVMQRLLAARPDVAFRIVSNEFPDWDLAETRPWSRDREVDDIAGFDIGIMPLSDTPWTRGKCGYKLIQYMAAGLPVVASPVGANREIVVHEGTGFLADSPEEWERFLGCLIDSPTLRGSMGESGRGRAEESFSVRSNAPLYQSVITGEAPWVQRRSA
jgi:glycosyltransferase involved in cell wall biosynthesis